MLLAVALALGANLGGAPLLDSDEVIYAQMAREMAAAGSWLDTTWMGAVLYEKPPLLFWLLRISGEIFGWTDTAMRLPGVLAGVVAVGYAMRLAAPAGRRSSWLAAGAVVATVGYVMTVRRPLTDPLLAAAVLGALYHATRPARGVALGLALGLGTLAKSVAIGPAALVSGVHLLRGRRFRELVVAIAVGAVVVAPWHLAMTLRHGADFWQTYLGYHVAERAAAPLVGAAGLDYYATTAFEVDPLMATLLLLGLVAGTATWLRRWPNAPSGLVLATAWLTLVLLHAAGTRLYHYLLPVFPLAAVAGAVVVGPLLRHRLAAVAAAAVCVGAFVTGPLGPHILDPSYDAFARDVARDHLRDLPLEAEIVVWESYAPSMTWYADRPVRMWTQNQRFWDIQSAVDMMRRSGAVVWADDAAMTQLVQRPEPVVFVLPRPEAVLSLQPWLAAAARHRDIQVRMSTGPVARVIVLGGPPG